jgi:hypothetical protein
MQVKKEIREFRKNVAAHLSAHNKKETRQEPIPTGLKKHNYNVKDTSFPHPGASQPCKAMRNQPVSGDPLPCSQAAGLE